MKKTKIIGGIVLLSLFIVPKIALAQWNVSELFGWGLPEMPIMTIVVNIMMWLLGILGFIGIIGFAISGIMYLISAGDDAMIKRAKNGMLFSIVGIVVGLAGVVLIRAIDSMLNASRGF